MHAHSSVVTACRRAGAKSTQKQRLQTSCPLKGGQMSMLLAWRDLNGLKKKALPGKCSILLVPVWVVDELPVQLLGLIRIELLTAFTALKAGTNLDPNILSGAITRLCCVADLHSLRHDWKVTKSGGGTSVDWAVASLRQGQWMVGYGCRG